ncbi:MAG: DNA repair protein RadC [Rikenellaceae bacterium]
MYEIKPTTDHNIPTERDLLSNKIKFGKLCNLTDAELLYIALNRSGDSIAKVQNILEQFGGDLSEICLLDLNVVMRRTNLASKPAQQLLAIVEMSQRIKYSSKKEVEIVKNSADIMTLLYHILGHKIQEEFWVVFLNNSNRVLEKTLICQGSIDNTIADTKLIIRRALNLLATKIILAHNHPSGNLKPSSADIETTTKITNAAALFDIKVIDHIIISGTEYYSFNDNQ